VLLSIVLATGGCGDVLHDDLVGSWSDPSGRSLPDGTANANGIVVVSTYLASNHCQGRKNTVYLELAWPIGQPANLNEPGGGENLRFYVRGDSVEHRVSSEPFDDDVALPAAATPTGFMRAGNSISVDSVGPAYVTRANGRTERWPQIALGCA
jgi:hypothetical protein